jgi:hypothetical protein
VSPGLSPYSYKVSRFQSESPTLMSLSSPNHLPDDLRLKATVDCWTKIPPSSVVRIHRAFSEEKNHIQTRAISFLYKFLSLRYSVKKRTKTYFL